MMRKLKRRILSIRIRRLRSIYGNRLGLIYGLIIQARRHVVCILSRVFIFSCVIVGLYKTMSISTEHVNKEIVESSTYEFAEDCYLIAVDNTKIYVYNVLKGNVEQVIETGSNIGELACMGTNIIISNLNSLYMWSAEVVDDPIRIIADTNITNLKVINNEIYITTESGKIHLVSKNECNPLKDSGSKVHTLMVDSDVVIALEENSMTIYKTHNRNLWIFNNVATKTFTYIYV